MSSPLKGSSWKFTLPVASVALLGGLVCYLQIPLLLAYSASAMERLGLTDLAVQSYGADVARYPTQAPKWAFARLAELQRESSFLVDIAELALKGQHKELAIQMYEAAVNNSGQTAPIEWITKWAELVSIADPNKAADLFLSAAKLELIRDPMPSDRVFGYIESSLVLRDDPDVRWGQAQLYMAKDIARAEAVLRRMILAHQLEHVASHETAAAPNAFRRGIVTSAEESIALRKSYWIRGFYGTFKEALDMEQAAIAFDIKFSFSTRKATILEKFKPAKEQQRNIINTQQTARNEAIMNIRKNTYAFNVELHAPELNQDCVSAASSNCRETRAR